MFFIGIMTAGGALVLGAIFLIVGTILGMEPADEKIVYYMLSAVLIEESLRAAAIWKISQKNSSGKELLLSSLLIGAGFAFLETILNLADNGSATFSPYLGLFLIHIATSMVFSRYFSSKLKRNFPTFTFVFLFAAALHFIFNKFVYQDLNRFPLYAFLAMLIALLSFLALKGEKKSRLQI